MKALWSGDDDGQPRKLNEVKFWAVVCIVAALAVANAYFLAWLRS